MVKHIFVPVFITLIKLALGNPLLSSESVEVSFSEYDSRVSIKIPELLDHLYKELATFPIKMESGAANGESIGNKESKDSVLLRTWDPTEITGDPKIQTVLHFVQKQDHLKFLQFKKAHLILKNQNNFKIASDSTIRVTADRLESHSSLNEKRRHHAVEITDLLKSQIAPNLGPHPKHISLNVNFVQNNETSIGEIFDLQKERPYILLQYFELPDEKLDSSLTYLSQEKTLDRKKRDLSFPSEYISENEVEVKKPETRFISSMCQRRPLWVKTSELELNLYRPQAIDIGYCAGTCPFPLIGSQYNATLHSIILAHFRFSKGFEIPKNIPSVCCASVSYQPVRVVMIEEDNSFVIKELPDVSVKSCGCR